MGGIEAVAPNMDGSECGNKIGVILVSTGSLVSFYCTKPKGHRYPERSIKAEAMAEFSLIPSPDSCEFRYGGLVVKEEK